MIPVEEARARILSAFQPLPAEAVALSEGLGRTLAEDVLARVTQPREAVSAMDGYAVRAADVAHPPTTLTVAGEAPAGGSYDQALQPGEAVRIFTGGPLPHGADSVVIQENTEAQEDGQVLIKIGAEPGQFVRPAGLDFRAGDLGIAAGRVLSARDIGLAAAMNVPWLKVRRRPRIAILSTGDELVLPGEPLAAHQQVGSNAPALAAYVSSCGGQATNLGIAPDRKDALAALSEGARGADLLVTTGGASVGKHDLVQSALSEAGMALDFWKIAMRPGKPLMFGRLGEVPVLGLPGNPVSSLVCAVLFLGPAIEVMMGRDPNAVPTASAELGNELPANDRRQDYLRGSFVTQDDGRQVVTTAVRQDSSMLATLAHADCLVVRPPFAPPAQAGERVEIVLLKDGVC
ncbi:MAG: gephyrin-like molybdotransferase Glp [Pseudomonadota bacterium]